ncbi:protein phosphatase 2C 51-like [Hevea brasiliensis]|uniref:protein phosphatase 2C 51-like n=1 Tax=Hevea brasiliensis TaxID=3981 RepID=UPI0025D09A06|nr:protein phosphatase 2C 51-like [Hevea brasiliensis]
MSECGGETHLKRSNYNFRRRGLDTNKMKYICSVDGLFLDDGGEYTKNKKRGPTEVTFSEDADFRGKEPKIHDANSNEAKLSQKSAYSDCFKGKKVVKPVGIIRAGCEGDGDGSTTCVSHGSISVIGRRRAMEDALTIAPGVAVGEFDSYDFFAVCDGHGGARVANACRDRMHQLVAKEVEKGRSVSKKGLDYWEKVMGTCFKKMDDEVSGGGSGGEELSERTVGSTAAVVLVGREELVVPNCGDSRVVMCRGGVAVALSSDHKPDRPDERGRVEAAGGRVIYWNGSRVLGVLGTSRAIGDQYLKPYVTSEPKVTVSEHTESDDFIVIGTDGLWDVVSRKFACEILKKYFDGRIKNRRFVDKFAGGGAREAAAMLAELAMARGSEDMLSQNNATSKIL